MPRGRRKQKAPMTALFVVVNIVFVNYAKKQDGSKLDMVKNSEYNGYGCITIVEKRCYVASFAVATIFKMITKGCKAARR